MPKKLTFTSPDGVTRTVDIDAAGAPTKIEELQANGLGRHWSDAKTALTIMKAVYPALGPISDIFIVLGDAACASA